MGFVCMLWCLPTSRYILFGCSTLYKTSTLSFLMCTSLPSAQMRSEGTVVNPRRPCAARVTVVGFVCVSISLLECLFVSKKDTIYLTGNEGQKLCGVISWLVLYPLRECEWGVWAFSGIAMQCETSVMDNAQSVIVLGSLCVYVLMYLPTSRYILFGCSTLYKTNTLSFLMCTLFFKLVYILLASSPRAFPPCCRDLCTVENKKGESLVLEIV